MTPILLSEFIAHYPRGTGQFESIAAHPQKNWGILQRRAYLKDLDATFHFLADSPIAGVACDYIANGLKKHPHKQHITFYKHPKNTVVIVRVLHRSMDVERHFS